MEGRTKLIKNAMETLTDKIINDIMIEQRRQTLLSQGKHYENTTIPTEGGDSYDEFLSGLSTGLPVMQISKG